MHAFFESTLRDIRSGRESWRVFAAVCTPSFVLAVAVIAVRNFF